MDRITARSDVGLSHLSTTGIFERVAGPQRSWSWLPLTLADAQVPNSLDACGEPPETKAHRGYHGYNVDLTTKMTSWAFANDCAT